MKPGFVYYDTDGYAHVRVHIDGRTERWCLTDHDVERIVGRGYRRPEPTLPPEPPPPTPSAWERFIFAAYRTLGGIRG